MNSNLQCQAAASNKFNLYVYCPIEEDVTLSANWVVADSSIVRMLEPGIFTAVGPGHTFVRATWERLTSPMRPVSVFPGTPPIPTGERTRRRSYRKRNSVGRLSIAAELIGSPSIRRGTWERRQDLRSHVGTML